MTRKNYKVYKTGDILISKTNINIRDWDNRIIHTIPKGSILRVVSSNITSPDRLHFYGPTHSYICGSFIKYPELNQIIFYKYRFEDLPEYDPNQEPEDDCL